MARNANNSTLISSTSILIMSGFMIGLTVGKYSGDELSPFLLAGGLSGFLAFLALDLTAARRSQKEKEDNVASIERRLERHTHSLSSVGFTLTPISNAEIDEMIDCQSPLHADSEDNMTIPV
ncbi:hypothetical protein KOR42_31000 [Thalassoglobus neptunius]|uniref:Uncharacterized protein n=1 Tax=Thalassoglobus neptunius TaxID=1938619 RepID=A0A5C5WR00_9PLAN|nr:hypothetical protein [Thalassoglobus neptunius]TWT52232.1 hypothetical protein KOR42_31000 [Thalassoglobus neptunius]